MGDPWTYSNKCTQKYQTDGSLRLVADGYADTRTHTRPKAWSPAGLCLAEIKCITLRTRGCSLFQHTHFVSLLQLCACAGQSPRTCLVVIIYHYKLSRILRYSTWGINREQERVTHNVWKIFAIAHQNIFGDSSHCWWFLMNHGHIHKNIQSNVI